MSEQTSDAVRHVVRITHDPESHGRCMKVLNRLDQDGALDYDERVDERGGVAHGVDHQRIDGMWMTPSEMCLARAAEEDDSYYLIPDFADGDHAVTIDYEEGYLSVLACYPPGQSQDGAA